jgi:ribosomal protein S18 acetylase RimI-like enzyme
VAESEALALRPYEAGDHGAVIALHRAALEPTGAYLGSGPWDADLDDIEGAYARGGGLFLVGERQGRIVAMGGVRLVPPDGQRGLVTRMRVAPDLQGRGYGRALLAALEAHARARGVAALALDTTTRQDRAMRLYRAAGYRESGRRRLRGLEVVLFEKSLDGPGSSAARAPSGQGEAPGERMLR